MKNNNRWHKLETADEIAQVVCERILNLANQAIEKDGKFKIVLAGGTTPEKVYRLLKNAETNWSKWFVYHGDERVLSVDHVDRNSVMAAKAFLNEVSIPKNQIFDIPTELGVKESAESYKEIIKKVLPFDLVLLGMGEDGHTASLFPAHELDENELVHEVYNSPKPPSERVSLSVRTLNNTENLFFLITGANKKEALEQWLSGVNLPVTQITIKNGVDIFVDSAAVADLIIT